MTISLRGLKINTDFYSSFLKNVHMYIHVTLISIFNTINHTAMFATVGQSKK